MNENIGIHSNSDAPVCRFSVGHKIIINCLLNIEVKEKKNGLRQTLLCRTYSNKE